MVEYLENVQLDTFVHLDLLQQHQSYIYLDIGTLQVQMMNFMTWGSGIP